MRLDYHIWYGFRDDFTPFWRFFVKDSVQSEEEKIRAMSQKPLNIEIQKEINVSDHILG